MLSERDVREAAARIAGQAVRTPLLRSDALDAATGARIWLKPECLQRTGSFKFRGAYNRLSAMSAAERRGGVVAYSSGNHAQGVAFAAKLLGMPAVIVMPTDAPAVKVARTRGHGAEVVFYDRYREDRAAIAAALAETRGAVIVPPFDDPHVIAGQGTAGLEVAEDLAAMGVAADFALVCCGGGGLAGGFAIGSGLPLIVVEPVGYDDVMRSLAASEIRTVENPGPTVCDALQTLAPSARTFGILQAAGARGVVVSDEQALAAVAFAFRELKLVLEPGGAVALAAALSGAAEVAGRSVVVVLSGGNVEPAIFARAVGASEAAFA